MLRDLVHIQHQILCWLEVSNPQKNILVNWDYDSNIYGKKCSKPPTSIGPSAYVHRIRILWNTSTNSSRTCLQFLVTLGKPDGEHSDMGKVMRSTCSSWSSEQTLLHVSGVFERFPPPWPFWEISRCGLAPFYQIVNMCQYQPISTQRSSRAESIWLHSTQAVAALDPFPTASSTLLLRKMLKHAAALKCKRLGNNIPQICGCVQTFKNNQRNISYVVSICFNTNCSHHQGCDTSTSCTRVSTSFNAALKQPLFWSLKDKVFGFDVPHTGLSENI